MPLSADSVGAVGDRVCTAIDARWTMAYAAALGDSWAGYLDTNACPDVVAHPLFPVCFEWPIFLAMQGLPENADLTPDERLRGVHATHDLVLHRPLRAGQKLWTRARVVEVEARAPGAYQVVRFDSCDESDAPVCTTWYGTLYRGVGVIGEGLSVDDERPSSAQRPADATPCDELEISVPAMAAHVYSECARIWNPIHTDAAVAVDAGLPGIILHGTATLALAVSAIIGLRLPGDPERVTRVTGAFRGTVAMPSTLRVRVFEARRDGAFPFEVLNERGEPAIRDGLLGVCS